MDIKSKTTNQTTDYQQNDKDSVLKYVLFSELVIPIPY